MLHSRQSLVGATPRANDRRPRADAPGSRRLRTGDADPRADSQAHADADRNADTYAYPLAYGHTHAYGHADAHTHANGHADAQPDPNGYPRTLADTPADACSEAH